MFPFSHPPGDENENDDDDDVSFGCVFGETSLTEHTGTGYVSGEQDRLLSLKRKLDCTLTRVRLRGIELYSEYEYVAQY